MPRVVLARVAEEDIIEIFAWSHEHFGEPARLRNEALLTQAIIDIAGGLTTSTTVTLVTDGGPGSKVRKLGGSG